MRVGASGSRVSSLETTSSEFKRSSSICRLAPLGISGPSVSDRLETLIEGEAWEQGVVVRADVGKFAEVSLGACVLAAGSDPGLLVKAQMVESAQAGLSK